MREQVTIDRRFRGPPDSANGGYVCGLLAGFLDTTAEVTLRRPPPIERPLTIEGDSGRVSLCDGETLIAEAVPSRVDIDAPSPVSFEDASVAAKGCVALKQDLPYVTCFVCGVGRSDGDGLRIFPGALNGRDAVAAPWIPEASLADDDGAVRPEFVWSALDCPGAFAFIKSASDVIMLGRLTANIVIPVPQDGRFVVMGWPLGSDGRKLYAGSALFSENGTLHALAKATWIKLES